MAFWICKTSRFSNSYISILLIGSFLTTVYAFLLSFDVTSTWNYPILLAIIWTTLSPKLISSAERTINWFCNYVKPVLSNESFLDLQAYSMELFFARKSYLCSGIMAGVMGLAGMMYGHINNYETSLIVFVTLLHIVAGMMAGIGFWGLFAAGMILRKFCKYDFNIDPFCADNYGGLFYVGRFIVITISLFYSGSLFVPIAMDLARSAIKNYSAVFSLSVLAAYIAIGLSIFFRSIVTFHDKMLAVKIQVDNESQAVLSELVNRYLLDVNKPGGGYDPLKPLVYYIVHHKRIVSMKDYPFDAKSIFQVAASSLIPVIIFLADMYIKA